MLIQRRRRWANIKTTVVQRVVFDGIMIFIYKPRGLQNVWYDQVSLVWRKTTATTIWLVTRAVI